MIPCAVFVASLDMRSMLVLVLYDSFGGKMVNASLSDAWGVGQHLEHRSSDLSESDVLFLWLLCAGGKCFDHLQANQTTINPYASMRA